MFGDRLFADGVVAGCKRVTGCVLQRVVGDGCVVTQGYRRGVGRHRFSEVQGDSPVFADGYSDERHGRACGTVHLHGEGLMIPVIGLTQRLGECERNLVTVCQRCRFQRGRFQVYGELIAISRRDI